VNHEALAAEVASLACEGHVFASGAGNVKGAPAPGANLLSFLYCPQAGGAAVAVRAKAVTLRANAAVPLNHGAAMETRLFVGCHGVSPFFSLESSVWRFMRLVFFYLKVLSKE